MDSKLTLNMRIIKLSGQLQAAFKQIAWMNKKQSRK